MYLVLFAGGNTEPSMEDIPMSKLLVEAAKALDQKVFDSLIVTVNEGYSSLAERCLI